MDGLIERQVERIHGSPTMAVLALAGGGAQALGWLLGAPGASRTILEATVPYAAPAMAEFLGHEPGQVVSQETAGDMARSAYERAARLAPSGVPIVGIGCTAAIATDRLKRGEHRCFVSAWTERSVTTYRIGFVKKRDRGGEDEIVSRLVLRALAEASGAELDLPQDLDAQERVEVARAEHGDLVEKLLSGHVKSVVVRPDGSMTDDAPVRGGVLPGAFDPLHTGHEAMAQVAAAMLDTEVTFEMSVLNVDKPPMEAAELRRRLAQFGGKRAVALTRTPRFYEKAGLFPGCTFVIGWDTAARLVEPSYYDGDEAEMLRALSNIRESGCHFLVAGRMHDGAFRTLDDVPVPVGFEDLFTDIPEAAFRSDISSSELRVAGRRR